MPEARPKGVSLASATASSSVSKETTERTGPKNSSASARRAGAVAVEDGRRDSNSRRRSAPQPPVTSSAPASMDARDERLDRARVGGRVASGPTSVAMSSGEPIRIASAFALRLARKSSLTLRSTMRREPATQLWPVAAKMPATWALAALSRSASAKTTKGDLPPSSSEVRGEVLGRVAHDMRGRRSGPPVKAMWATLGMAGQRAPQARAEAGDDIDDARREAGLVDEAREFEQRRRAILGCLDHQRAARGQRRADLDGGEEELAVPGHDRGDDADRLAARSRPPCRACRSAGARLRSCRRARHSSGSSRRRRRSAPRSRG